LTALRRLASFDVFAAAQTPDVAEFEIYYLIGFTPWDQNAWNRDHPDSK
jgi:hypothetical protein